MQAVETPWGRMHLRLERRGDPAPMVLLASLGTDLRMWDGLCERLDAGPILRLDFRGTGLSSDGPAAFTIADLAEDVRVAMDAVGLERAVVVGSSLGGLVAQRLALALPDRVAGLVLANTAARIGTAESWGMRIAAIEAGGMAAVAADILRRWFGARMLARPEAGLWQTMLARHPVAGYLALCRAIAGEDLTEAVGAIRAPCLVLAGEEDQATPPPLVRALAEAIPGARFELMSGVGHLPAIEAPEAFARIVAEFAKGCAP